jgi:predicted TIM-barrel fold metal-dependent hydrolase
MERFFYDTAMAFTPAPLSALMKVVKPTQVVFGTDYPFGSSAAVAAGLRQSGLFTADDLMSIERGNAVRLIPRLRA